MVHTVGINSILATPILVNGNKFAECIVISSVKDKMFQKYDQILVQDIAPVMGASVYAKQMGKVAEKSNRILKEILHSMILVVVISKIELFRDQNLDEYQSGRSSNTESLIQYSINDMSEGSGDILDGYENNWGEGQTRSCSLAIKLCLKR